MGETRKEEGCERADGRGMRQRWRARVMGGVRTEVFGGQ